MFKTILVPLDGSALAEQALGRAGALARAASGTMDLTLVHRAFPFEATSPTAPRSELWHAEADYLENVAENLSATEKLRITHGLMRGDPVDMICQRVKDVKADLVVMTTHARTGLNRAWMGSVTDGVVRFSSVPVLALRPKETPTRHDPPHALFKHILIPVDGSAAAEEIVAAATALADTRNGGLTLLRVVEPIPLIAMEPGLPTAYMAAFINEPSTQRLAREAKEELTHLAARLQKESGLTVDTAVIIERHVGQAITEFARDHDVDLIAMTTHGRGVSRLLLGSVADKVMRGASVPLLLFRPQAMGQPAPIAADYAATAVH